MSRILLADDSPQALRLGEQILRGQGIEVVSVTDGAIALRRLNDVNPDLFITDVYLPTKNGFELARYMKAQASIAIFRLCSPPRRPMFSKSRMPGMRERTSFCANLSRRRRSGCGTGTARKEAAGKKDGSALPGGGFDRNSIRAAVTLALDSAMPAMIEELTERVVLALSHRK